jgi:hypothetical protein
MAYESVTVYREQGGGALVIRSRDGGVVKGQSTANGAVSQAAAIAAVATADADAAYGQPEADLINELKSKVNLLLTACRNAGVMAP